VLGRHPPALAVVGRDEADEIRVFSPESKTTTGMFWRCASATGSASATSSSGAMAMPETPRVIKPSISEICEARSSSRSGPRQITVTPSSCAAFSAPP
jgi:hypothetical protein